MITHIIAHTSIISTKESVPGNTMGGGCKKRCKKGPKKGVLTSVSPPLNASVHYYYFNISLPFVFGYRLIN